MENFKRVAGNQGGKSMKCSFCGDNIKKCDYHNCVEKFKKGDYVICYYRKHFCCSDCLIQYLFNNENSDVSEGVIE